jgi:hypothetical protein
VSAQPPEDAVEASSSSRGRRERRRGLSVGELLVASLRATQTHGVTPFSLAFVTLAPAAFVATALGYWFAAPGSLLVVALVMSAFGIYVAVATPLLLNPEAAARKRSLSELIDKTDARMPSLALAGGVSGLVVAAGLELRLLPGFLLLGLLALTAPAIAREKLGPLRGLRRGLRFTQGNAVAFMLLGAVIGATCLGVYAFLAFVLDPLPIFMGEFVAVAATATVAAPIAAHAFVLGFDGRVAGKRLAVRPPAQSGSRGAISRARTGLEHAFAGTRGDGRTSRSRATEARLSFTSHRPPSSRLRYSPEAATTTFRIAPANTADETSAIPDWAHSDESALSDELHTAV